LRGAEVRCSAHRNSTDIGTRTPAVGARPAVCASYRGAGGAAHLPGMVAILTLCPSSACRLKPSAQGLDSLSHHARKCPPGFRSPRCHRNGRKPVCLPCENPWSADAKLQEPNHEIQDAWPAIERQNVNTCFRSETRTSFALMKHFAL